MEHKKTRPPNTKLEVTFLVDLEHDEDYSVDEIIEHETEYIAEPKSTNGCVISMTVKDIKKI